MPQLSPRRLGFRGQIEVAALAFSRSLISSDELQKRVLALWQTSARLEEFGWGHVLFLPSPQRMRADESPATPLVKVGNRFLSAPLERTQDFDGGVWIIEGGEWRALGDGKSVDVSSWIDASKWSVATTTSLGELPPTPLVLAPVELDLRAGSGIGAPDAKWQTIWERSGANASTVSGSRFFERLSGLFTPRRDVNGLPIASHFSIVLSSVLVLGGAGWFCLSAFLGSASAPHFPMQALVVVVAVAFAFGLLSLFKAMSGRHSGSARVTPMRAGVAPIVVSNGVALVALVLIGWGVVRIAARDFHAAVVALAMLLLMCVVAVLSGLAGRLVGSTATGIANGAGAPAPLVKGAIGASWWTRLFGSRGATGGLLARFFGSRSKSGAAPKPKTRDDAGDLWRRLLARAALQSGLFKTLGRAQARYLMRSMELFERGDLEAALRHAIALGGASDSAWSPPPALGLPGARADLGLSLFNAPVRGSMNFGPEVEQKLRTLYRNAFERLRDQGDWEKAAFVLADLLQNVEEAVAFLEEQKQFELAAKLAEGRNLAPGLVVRAWWLAGNRERALHIARLKEAFADAITRLERDPNRKDDAAHLRLLWGHHLAELGRFAPAVEAVWPVPEGRALAQKWLRLGLEHHASPRLVARALSLEPANWSEWRPFLDTLWDERDEDGARAREWLARELVQQKNESNPALQVAARQTARRVLDDGARGLSGIEKAMWDNLLSLSGDGILRADSKWPAPKPKPSAFGANGEALEIRIEGDGGTLRARDAVLLPGGELLVALGEVGARLLSREGKTKAHFDVPAHEIVRAFDAPRALLLARRDETLRVSKLDLTSRKTAFWGDVRASCFADNFDGATWFAATDGRVRAFDVSASSPSSLWDSGELNGHAAAMAIARTSLAVLAVQFVEDGAKCESWRFELPALVLRERRTPAGFTSHFINAHGHQFEVSIAEDEARSLMWAPEKTAIPIEIGAQDLHDVRFSTQNESVMLCWQDENSSLASLLRPNSLKITARVRFAGARFVGARECDGVWLIWDDLGRVVAWNGTSGHIERQWVLS